jgi:hypothetical protein
MKKELLSRKSSVTIRWGCLRFCSGNYNNFTFYYGFVRAPLLSGGGKSSVKRNELAAAQQVAAADTSCASLSHAGCISLTRISTRKKIYC